MSPEEPTPHSQLEKAAPFGRSYLLGGVISIFLAFKTVPKLDYVSWIHLALLVLWLTPWVRKGSIPCHIRLTLVSTWTQIIVSLLLITSVHQEMIQSTAKNATNGQDVEGYYILGFFLMSTVIIVPWLIALLQGYKLVILGHQMYPTQKK